jgi:hypothetical protein
VAEVAAHTLLPTQHFLAYALKEFRNFTAQAIVG